jgi:FeS assembly protein IscX
MLANEENPQSVDLPVDESPLLSWEDTYEIALALRERHPEADLHEVSLGMIYHWSIDLPNFFDDRELANEEILLAIYQEWYEEVNSL